MFSNVSYDFVGSDFKDVEMNCLGKWSALSDEDDVSLFDCESRGTVSGDVSVSFFVSVVFGNIVKIISSDNYSSLHFGWDYDTLQDLSSDGDIGGEWTFFINVIRLDGFFGSFKVESDILIVSDSWGCFFGEQFFTV